MTMRKEESFFKISLESIGEGKWKENNIWRSHQKYQICNSIITKIRKPSDTELRILFYFIFGENQSLKVEGEQV